MSAELETAFKKFATKAGCATSKDMDRWFKDAKAYGKNCSSNNLDIAFSKVKTKGKTTITYEQALNLIKDVAPKYKLDKKCATDAEAEEKLKELLAGTSKKDHGTTGTSKTGNVDGFTDTSTYTGSHKERFDADGKGKGAEGRSDKADSSGYVGNYKGAGTYDKKK